MQGFLIELENKPGELARLADALAQRGINITGLAAATSAASGTVGITTNDDDGTRSALNGAGIGFRETQLVAAGLDDKPGTLADAAKRLSQAGVNIELVIGTGRSGNRVDVAFGVDDAAKAREALGEMAGVGS